MSERRLAERSDEEAPFAGRDRLLRAVLVRIRHGGPRGAGGRQLQSEVASDAALTAVARSWEERFGAFVVSIGPGGLGMSVSAPPTTATQARALAAEQSAFTPEGDDDDLDTVAAALPHRAFWSFGWPD